MPELAARVRLLGISTALFAAAGCGAPDLSTNGEVAAGVDVGVYQAGSRVDAERPMLVEWPAVEKTALEAAAGRGTVFVSYDGKQLGILDGCVGGGPYAFTETSRSRDGFAIRNRTELYARLPLGAASLEAEIEAGGGLSLSYVAVGAKRAASTGAPARAGRCEGVTHFVRSMIVGAYEISRGVILGGGLSANIGSAGAGAHSESSSQVVRAGGDVAACLDPATPASDGRCQAIVQLVLEPIDAAPAQATAPAAPDHVSTAKPAAVTVVPTGWARCAAGQTWNGKGCPGLPYRVTWDEAPDHCPTGTRLPTKDELAALLGGCDELVRAGEGGTCATCDASPTCTAAFVSPSVRSAAYWTSTVSGDAAAWYVSFKEGQIRHTMRGNQFSVLCKSEAPSP